MQHFGGVVGALFMVGVVVAVVPIGCGIDTEGSAAEETARARDGGFDAAGWSSDAGGTAEAGDDGSAGAGGGAGVGGAPPDDGGGGGGSAGAGGDAGVGGALPDGGGAGVGDAGDGGGGSDVGADGGGGTGNAGAGGNGGAGGDAGAVVEHEDCTNGVDDDHDGDIDCADDDCTAGYVCTDVAPDGWAGYFWVHEAASAASAVEPCPNGGGAPTAYYSSPNDPACEACQCGALEGATCTAAGLACFESGDCGGSAHDWTSKVLAACAKPDLSGNKLSCKLSSAPALATAGTCPASGGSVTPASPWKTRTDVCGGAFAGGGCGGGQVCIPRASGPYEGSVCISKPDHVACPDGWGAPAKALFSSADDTRACSTCACAPTSDATCTGGTYTVHDSDLCWDIGAKPKVIDSSTCVDVSNLLSPGLIPLVPAWSVDAQAAKATGGSCTPSGGESSGSVAGKGPVTFCCK